jgi:MFS transporter, SHS family, sialic acid transporter
MSSPDQNSEISGQPRLPASVRTVSLAGSLAVLLAAFFGWFFAGFQLAITSQAMRSAAIDVLQVSGRIDAARYGAITKTLSESGRNANPKDVLSADDASAIIEWRKLITKWIAWYTCALMLGASVGGLLFGRIGDHFGRSPALAFSILCYSVFSGLTCYCRSPEELLLLRFLACLGVGGAWPNGVALVSEVWTTMSRPLVAGFIGTAANIGIFLFATLTTMKGYAIQTTDWRWVMELAAWPAVLGVFTLFFVPESPAWKKRRNNPPDNAPVRPPGVFQSQYLHATLLGISLAAIPLIGGWGSANWMVPWAGQAAETANPPQPSLEARVGQARSVTGIVGSLLGGWIASAFGRRRSYFLISLICLGCAQFTFWFLVPTDPSFLYWVAALGFFSGVYFGWLPLCLPELFPVSVRSTGGGVSFNFGRILTAVTLLLTGALQSFFQGDFARMGRVTSLVFALGLILTLWIPKTARPALDD